MQVYFGNILKQCQTVCVPVNFYKMAEKTQELLSEFSANEADFSIGVSDYRFLSSRSLEQCIFIGKFSQQIILIIFSQSSLLQIGISSCVLTRITHFTIINVMAKQGSVQVFYSGSYFCEIIVIFANFIVIFVKILFFYEFHSYSCELFLCL